MSKVRVDVLGSVTVSGPGGRLQGLDLGGRRARVALVALALHRRPMNAQRLAESVWASDPPPTWPAALRNVVRDLRLALAGIGLGEQTLITTQPNGYAISGAETEVEMAERNLDAAELLVRQAPAQALRMSEAAAGLHAEDLLPAEDATWLTPHRSALEVMRARAWQVIAAAAGELGDHDRAIAAGRLLVAENPIDERAHRTLLVALDGAGDRSGVVQAFERCRSLLADQLGVDPSAETVEVYLAALRSEPAPAGARLPATNDAFLARTTELAELSRALGRPGAVILVGRGGVGKTRLAREAATRLRGQAELRWVPLAGVPADELVAAHVALALGADASADPAGSLAQQLAPMGRTVLVLDGCEGVPDGISSLLAAVLPLCPELTVLATCRGPLAVEDEFCLEVQPLPHGAGGGAVEGDGGGPTAASALLRTRAAERGRPLPDDPTSRALIDTLCGRCAGLPLALELVAAQLVDTSLADLADELPNESEPDPDELTAVLDRSYQLLDDAEAALFRRCAVLAGPVSLPMIRAVAADETLPPLRVTRILRSLTSAGLLTVDRSGPRWRYHQDDDVRAYAQRQLSPADAKAALHRLGAALTGLLPQDPKASPMPFAQALTEVTGCLRSYLEACVDGPLPREAGLEFAFRLHRYWAARSIAEGRYWLGRLLDQARPGRWAALATFAYGYLVYWAGQAREALTVLQSAAEQLAGVEDSFRARALMYLAGILDDVDRGAEGLTGIQESARIAEEIGDDNLFVGATIGIGSILAERGDPAAAGFALAALDRGRANSPADQLAGVMPTAAQICWQVGDFEAARAIVQECRPLLGTGARIAHVYLLSVSAGLSLAEGDARQAVDFAGQARAEGAELGVERELPMISSLLAWALTLAGDPEGGRREARVAVQRAAALEYDGPLATALETAALVLEATGSGGSQNLAAILRGADAIRRAGNRPAVALFRDLVSELPAKSAPWTGPEPTRDDVARMAVHWLDQPAVGR